MSGILAVWNNRSEAIKREYEHWYNTEHIPERMALPGFRTARRFQAVDADRTFFTYYDLDSPDVMQTPVYKERLSNPTAQTKTMMPHFSGMVRSVFTEAAREGNGFGNGVGAALVVARYMKAPPAQLPAAALGTVPRSEIISARLWQPSAANVRTETAESKTRAEPDGVASGAIVVETMRADEAATIAAALRASREDGVSVGVYRLLCAFSA